MEYIPFLRNFDFDSIWMKINEMDYEGQKKSEKHHTYILYFFLIISMIFSFYEQKLYFGVYGVILGTLIAGIITVPSWPWYNKNALKWLPHEEKNIYKSD